MKAVGPAGASSSMPASWTVTMSGCESWAVALASRKTRAESSASVESSRRTVFTATRRPSSVSRASHTWPIPPCPTRLRSS